jgi:hypothetical protein
MTDQELERNGAMTHPTSLRLAPTLLLAGQLLYILITQFHAGGEANNHQEIFAEYASSDSWKAVHVGQFIAMALIIAGLLVFSSALEVPGRGAAWAARLGASFAVVALALYAILQAVDGIGNQEVDAAWEGAQGVEETARFASAEGMRWLEWGVRSYHDYALGLALLLISAAILRSRAVSQPIAYLVGFSGLAYLAQGWVVGADGFSGSHTILILMAWVLSLVWMIWLVVIARRLEEAEAPHQLSA